MPSDRRIDRPLVRFRGSIDDASVRSTGGFGFELGLEVVEGLFGFGNDDRACGVFVEAMDDAGTLNAVDAGKGFALGCAVEEQGVDEGAAAVAGGGMDDHACGFVNDDDATVFEENIQGNIFRWQRHGFRGWDGDFDVVVEFDLRFFVGAGAIVECDVPVGDQLLQARSGEVGDLFGEDAVEASGGFDREAEGFEIRQVF